MAAIIAVPVSSGISSVLMIPNSAATKLISWAFLATGSPWWVDLASMGVSLLQQVLKVLQVPSVRCLWNLEVAEIESLGVFLAKVFVLIGHGGVSIDVLLSMQYLL
jgi:hypothetical protein